MSRPRFVFKLLALIVASGYTAGSKTVSGQEPTTASQSSRIGRSHTSDNLFDFMTLYDSGWRLMAKGRSDLAEREFAAAFRITQRPGMNDSRMLARIYSALAWSMQEQGRYDEAEPLAHWALTTREVRFGPQGEPVARSLNQMAMIYLATNRFPVAEPLLRRVIAMDGGKSLVIELEQARSESLLGLGLVAQRRYAAGELAFTRAVAIRKEAQGLKDPELGDELNNLAWAQIEQGKRIEARPVMDQALKILRQTRGDNDPSVARALDGLARIDVEEKKYAEAELKFQRLIPIYERNGAGQQARRDDALKRYADLLDRVGRTADAARERAKLPKAQNPAPTPNEAQTHLTSPASPTQPVRSGPGAS